MSKQKRRKKADPLKVNETLAIADEKLRDNRTNAARPSKDAVEEAKEWVDNNKL